MYIQPPTAKQLTVVLITLLVGINPGIGAAATTTTASTHPTQPATLSPALEESEPNDATTNATRIAYSKVVNGTLSSSTDVDYYAVNATVGCATITRLHLKNISNGGNVQVDVVSPTGEVTSELANDVSTGKENVAPGFAGDDVAYTGNIMEHDGTYYIRVKKESVRQVNSTDTTQEQTETYRYNLTVNSKFVDKYEPNENGAAAATPIALGDAVNATFAGYDSDVYAVNVTAGEEYTVTLSHPVDMGHTHATKQVWIYENRSQPADDAQQPRDSRQNRSPYDFTPNGTTAATIPTFHTGTASVEFQAEKTGQYYIQIIQGELNSNLFTQNPYRLTVNKTSGNDVPENATRLVSGETIRATLSPGEEDWYAVTAQAGRSLEANIWSQAESSLPDSVQVDIVSASGDVLSEDQDPAADPHHSNKILESDGTYYIRVADTSEQSNATNASAGHAYGLGVSVRKLDQYDPNENAATATPLAVNETLTARIAGIDSDVYAVDVETGQTYTVTLNETNYIDTERRLLVYDTATGVTDDPSESNTTPIVHTSGDNSTSTVTFTADADSTYYVQVTREFGETPMYMDYTLTVSSRGTDSDSDDGDSDAELNDDPENGRLLETESYELTVTETGPNDEMANATPIEYEQDIVTTLSAGEGDWYAVDGRSGRKLLADIRTFEHGYEGLL